MGASIDLAVSVFSMWDLPLPATHIVGDVMELVLGIVLGLAFGRSLLLRVARENFAGIRSQSFETWGGVYPSLLFLTC